MKQEHERLSWISTGYIVKLDSICLHILVLAQSWVEHAVRRRGSFGALEEEDWVTHHFHQELEAHCNGP
jgi:CRISPR/Cas system-associated endonuclease Cas3-HD